MNSQNNTVDARWIGRAFANDRDLRLPVRPRLIPEIMSVPAGDGGLLFFGGENEQLIRGKSVHGVLPRVLPLLDGRRTLDQITALSGAVDRRALHDIVSLLFSRGLLEDGAPHSEQASSLGEVESFLGRFVDVTRSNRNRGEALGRLAGASVAVFGSQLLVNACVGQLGCSGIRYAACGEFSASRRCDVSIVISTGDLSDADGLAREASRKGRRLMLVRMGQSAAYIGPMLYPGLTSCVECLLRLHPHPQGSPGPHLAQYWVSLATLQVVHTLAKLAPRRQREFQMLSIDEAGEMKQTTYECVRTPGCGQCGIPHSPLRRDDPRLIAWIYHCATSFPSRELLSPRDHQSHYSTANIHLASEEKPPLREGAAAVTLPEALALTQPLDWNAGGDARRIIDVSILATVLARTAGQIHDNGSRRRVAPTGGNLGSVDLWVAAKAVRGLGSGIYRYNAARHRLERARDLAQDVACESIRVQSAPDCLIVGTGDLARCSRKYQNFAYRLAQYDSGVALAWLYAVCANMEVPVTEYANYDDTRLAGLLGIAPRWEFPVPTFAVALGTSPDAGDAKGTAAGITPDLTAAEYSSEDLLLRMLRGSSAPLTGGKSERTPRHTEMLAPDVAVTSLDDILRTRRAVREYSDRPVGRAALELLMLAATEFARRRIHRGAPPCWVRPVLGIANGQGEISAGLYEANSKRGLLKRADFGPALMRECFNQTSFGNAPAAIFTVGDLGGALSERGVCGYRELSQHAGSMIGHVWLAATSLGLSGSAAGGVIPSGLHAAAGMDGFNECPLLAFPFGVKAPGFGTQQEVI
jgi:SagB-type dehydrogenase family enzyme